MRLVISPKAIESMQVSNQDSMLLRQIRASHRAVTIEILEDYRRTLGTIFEPWFANEMVCNGFRLLGHGDTLKLPNNSVLGSQKTLAIAAFVWGKAVVGNNFGIQEKEAFESFGLHTFDLNCGNGMPHGYGYNPIQEWVLHRGDLFNSINLKRLFRHHCNIVVLDRFFYTKPAAQNLLKVLLKEADSNFKLTIFGTDGSTPAANTTKTSFKNLYQNATISTLISDLDSRLHDRHIILDNKIQISITSGLDIFNDTSGEQWAASSDGTICFYSLLDYSSLVNLSGRNSSGTVQRKSIALAKNNN